MSQSDFRVKEKFVLSSDNQSIIDTLTEGSDDYYLFYIVQWLNTNKIPNDIKQKVLNYYKEKGNPSYNWSKVYRRSSKYVSLLFYLYDRANSEEEKKEILKEMKEKVYELTDTSFNHLKPSYIKTTNATSNSQKLLSSVNSKLFTVESFVTQQC